MERSFIGTYELVRILFYAKPEEAHAHARKVSECLLFQPRHDLDGFELKEVGVSSKLTVRNEDGSTAIDLELTQSQVRVKMRFVGEPDDLAVESAQCSPAPETLSVAPAWVKTLLGEFKFTLLVY